MIVCLVALAFVLKSPAAKPVKAIQEPFKIDQLLIKVLLKDNESFTIPVNVMDISDKEIFINLSPLYLNDIVSITENSFLLKPGQTKSINLDFHSSIPQKSIKQKPGAYVGALRAESGDIEKQVPIIVEIETEQVLFDVNLNIHRQNKPILLGSSLDIEITLFNLKRIGLTNVKMNYFLKDVMGNTILTESETLVVDTQATFSKTLEIPANLNPGNYIFIVESVYGNSVGTSTFLFKVSKSESRELIYAVPQNINKLTYISIFSLAIVLFLYILFNYLHNKSLHALKTKPGHPVNKQRRNRASGMKHNLMHTLNKPSNYIKSKLENSKRHIDLELLKKIKEWKKKGYDTSILEKKLRKINRKN